MVRSGGHTTVWLFAVVSLADTLPDQREQRVATVRTKPPKSSTVSRRGQGPTVTGADYEALAEFRYELRKFLAFSEEAALAMGLTPQQHQALLAIRGAPDTDSLSVKQIAERLLVRHHTAVGLIDRLVDLDMVIRTPDSADRRRIQVSLTKTGHSALHGLSAIHVAELKNIRPTLRKLLRQFET
jgi:DNA-binding MarR family transcriptional regulator